MSNGSSHEILGRVDVLVVGGGPAGIGAALGSARLGAKTLLIEHHGFFGGTAAWALGMGMNQMRLQGLPRSSIHEQLIRCVAAYGDQACRIGTHQVHCNVEYLKLAVMDALDEVCPGHAIDVEDIRPGLRNGFPWHNWEKPHLELNSPELWWEPIEALIARVYQGVGIKADLSRRIAKVAHRIFIDPKTHGVFEDVIPVLGGLRERGWHHLILSNHVPELENIVKGLSIRNLFESVITSAKIGYEKPHPEAYRIALSKAGNPEVVWMIGDNPNADVKGAEKAGVPAILVRRTDESAHRQANDLFGVLPYLVG